MFNNIGEKIKGLAVIIFLIGVVIGCLVGFPIMGDSFWLGLLIIIIVVASSWLSVMMLYGYGEIISLLDELNGRVYELNVDLNKMRNEGIRETYQTKSSYLKADTEPVVNTASFWICPKCGTRNSGVGHYCKDCGEAKA